MSTGASFFFRATMRSIASCISTNSRAIASASVVILGAVGFAGPYQVSHSDLASRKIVKAEAATAGGNTYVNGNRSSSGNGASSIQPFNSSSSVKSTCSIISGSASVQLTKNICKELATSAEDVSITLFDDGELSFEIKKSIRGKNVFIVQALAASQGKSMNDNVMALILAITAARRANASSITAVIPYFSYKHNRRRQAITTPYHSRFLWSTSADLAKMLQTVGVDKIVSVELQRPGQGHEACFFDTSVPVETISTTNLFIDYLTSRIIQDRKLVIVSASTENLKKANKFQKKLLKRFPSMKIESGVFISNLEKYSSNTNDSELLADVNQADVIIVEEIVDVLDSESVNNLASLFRKLKNSGARRIILCAPHTVQNSESKRLIDLWPIEEIVTTDSILMPENQSLKVVQLPIARIIAKIIETEAKYQDGSLQGDKERMTEDPTDESYEVE